MGKTEVANESASVLQIGELLPPYSRTCLVRCFPNIAFISHSSYLSPTFSPTLFP